MHVPPFGVRLDLIDGVMEEPDHVVIRRAGDMLGYYADSMALEKSIDTGNPVHYSVYERVVPETAGNLLFCVSVLESGTVGAEYFMTKGHYHAVVDTAEIYLCLRGQGYLLMKTAEGEWGAEPMMRGRLVYVPPYWAHRTVNTGRTSLVSLCVYPAHAGHNYGDIEQEGFPRRVVCQDGRPTIV